MAKFEKGHPKLPGAGRPKGLQNQVTRDVREAIARFAEGNIDKFVGWLQEIEDPAKRCEIFLKTIEYHIPKLGRVEHTGNNGGPLQIVISKDEENL